MKTDQMCFVGWESGIDLTLPPEDPPDSEEVIGVPATALLPVPDGE